MFVNGSSIFHDNDDYRADWCFLPILQHNFMDDNTTWYLGSPILNDYYTVFDMSPASYIQIGIAPRNKKDTIG
jgi:hypothetical protein